jgi:lipoate---protein ligase
MSHRGEYKVPGGKLVVAEFTVVAGRLADVRITGDFFLFPDDAIRDIAAALNGAAANASPSEWAALIRSAVGLHVEMLGFGPDDVAEAVRRGLM